MNTFSLKLITSDVKQDFCNTNIPNKVHLSC